MTTLTITGKSTEDLAEEIRYSYNVSKQKARQAAEQIKEEFDSKDVMVSLTPRLVQDYLS